MREIDSHFYVDAARIDSTIFIEFEAHSNDT